MRRFCSVLSSCGLFPRTPMYFQKLPGDKAGFSTFQGARAEGPQCLRSCLTMGIESAGQDKHLCLTLFFFPRECSRIFGEDGLTLKLFLKRTAPFSILWTLTNYLYLLALKKLTATDVSALFCCNKAFVFLLSWIVLKDRFMGVRVMARSIPCACAVPPCCLNLTTVAAVPWSVSKTSPTDSEYKLKFEDVLGSPGSGSIMKGERDVSTGKSVDHSSSLNPTEKFGSLELTYRILVTINSCPQQRGV